MTTTPQTVTGLLMSGAGVAVAGQIQIKLSWDAWLADDSAEIIVASTVKITPASNGSWTSTLYANADLLPANSYYTVRESDGNGNWDPPFTIVVPRGGGNIASMVTSSPALPAQYVIASISDGVDGGAAASKYLVSQSIDGGHA